MTNGGSGGFRPTSGWMIRMVGSGLIGAALLCMPPSARAASPDGAAIIEKAMQQRDIDTLDTRLPEFLDGGLLDKAPRVGANAVLALARSQAAAGQWQKLDTLLSRHLDKARSVLSGEGDELLLLAGNAAGGLKDGARQDALLSRYVESVGQRTGESSKEALTARVDAAYARMTAGRAPEAEASMISALKAMEVHGQADLFFNTAGQAGGHFADQGLNDQAETIFDYGLKSRLNETDTGPGRGFLLFKVAAYMRDEKRYEDAQKTGLQALNLLTSAYGGDSEYSMLAYDGLAQSMHAAGQLAPAAAAYEFLEADAVRALGADNATVWQIRNNRAAVLRSLKLPAAALKSDEAAYNARYKALGGGANDTLISAVNMAHDLLDGERFDDAARVLKTIGSIAQGPGYNEGFRQRAAWLRTYAELRSGKQKLELQKIKSLDLSELEGADIEVWLAYLDLYGDAAEEAKLDLVALGYRQDAARRAFENLGADHPMTFDAMLGYADLMGRFKPEEAVEIYADLDSRLFEWTRANVSSGGSLDAARSAKILGDDAMRSLIDYAGRNEQGAEILAASVDHWKSMRSATDRRLREIADESGQADVRAQVGRYLRLAGNLREIVSTSLFTPDMKPLSDAMVAARNTLNGTLKAQNIALEVTPWYLSKPEPFAPLPRPAKGDVIVDFISYNTWPADRGGEASMETLYAVISRHDAPPTVERVYDRPFGQSEAIKFISGRVAKQLVGETLVKAAKDADAVYVSPTAALFQFPFAELLMPGGKRLGEAVDVHVIASRDAYEQRAFGAQPDKGAGLLLAGGLKYAADAGGDYLPGSRTEVRDISKLARTAGYPVETLQGNDATEKRLRQAVTGKGVVHLATHGFFVDDAALNTRLLNAGFLASRAGSGHAAEDEGDNVVHAREIFSWDLASAGLVVISACETAVSGEGVTSAGRGLPIALAAAGARRVLLTVETVGDESTAAFMQRFYSYVLEKGMTYDEAFIATKRDGWAKRIKGFSPGETAAYVLYQN